MSQAEDGIEPARRFATEIREQPAALRRLLEHDGEIARVAATASSGSAESGIVASAASASSEDGSFVTAMVNAPVERAPRRYSTTSGVRPDCERPITVEPDMSSGVP